LTHAIAALRLRRRLVLWLLSAGLARADEVPGLVSPRPDSGRFVETPQGYMVEYSFTIPGTKAVVEMVPVPGGVFRMGSPETEAKRQTHEGPTFEVEVEPYWMSKYEVTWAEYRQYMKLYGIFKEFETRQLRR